MTRLLLLALFAVAFGQIVPKPPKDYDTCTNFSSSPMPCTFATILGLLAGAMILARIVVGVLSWFRTAGKVVQVNYDKLSEVMAGHKNDPSNGPAQTEASGLNAKLPPKFKIFGVPVSIPSHHLGSYNYVLDCLNTTATDYKATILFGRFFHFKSIIWMVVAALELGTFILIAVAISQTLGRGAAIAAMVVSSFWALIYIYVNIHMLVNSSRDYWTCTYNFPLCEEFFGAGNELVRLTEQEIRLIEISGPNFDAKSVEVLTVKRERMVYEDRWMREFNYLPQVLAFHRLMFYLVSIMALSFSPPSSAAFGSWAVVYLAIYGIFLYYQKRRF